MNYSNSAHAQAFFRIIEISQIVEASIKKVLKEYQLTHGQYNILRILRGAKGEAITAKNIKERMILNHPDITRLVDRLLQKGLVERVKNPFNKREVNISLVNKGIELLSILDPLMKKAGFDFFENVISNTEAENLKSILTIITNDIKQR